MDGTIGEIRLIATTFAPRNWSYCDGSTIQIRSNTALFSILGTTYGGNGQTTFMLPDLKGRVVLGAGQGTGLSFYDLGQQSGTNSVTLTAAQLPPHTHSSSATILVPAYSDEGDANTPSGNVLASKSAMFSTEVVDTNLKAVPYVPVVSITGGSQPLPLSQPAIGMNYIICMYGTFPQRS